MVDDKHVAFQGRWEPDPYMDSRVQPPGEPGSLNVPDDAEDHAMGQFRAHKPEKLPYGPSGTGLTFKLR